MNPIDYWYKKYIALKECERMPKQELTWEDVKAIVNIADQLLDNAEMRIAVSNHSEKEYYEEVLKRFNEAKKNGIR